MHPLSGADPRTLAAVLAKAGPVEGLAARRLAEARRLIALRQPFSALERAWLAPQLPPLAKIPAPVFIVGHWRSGTTHLYQLMVRAGFGFVPPDATGLPWDLFFLAKLFRKSIEARLPTKRYIDNVPVRLDSPQEDEIALANMSPLSMYHGIYFPRRLRDFVAEGVFFERVAAADVERWRKTFAYFLRKLWLHQGKRRLLIKNPVYTARVGMLAAMMPEAKFLHIYRHPYDVYLSMRNFYEKLLPELALQPFDLSELDDLILTTYDRIMATLDADSAALPPERFAAMRYEAFMAEPLASLEAAWAQLRLGDFEAHQPAFAAYLEGQRSFEPNRFVRDPEAERRIAKRLALWYRRWNYPEPG